MSIQKFIRAQHQFLFLSLTCQIQAPSMRIVTHTQPKLHIVRVRYGFYFWDACCNCINHHTQISFASSFFRRSAHTLCSLELWKRKFKWRINYQIPISWHSIIKRHIHNRFEMHSGKNWNISYVWQCDGVTSFLNRIPFYRGSISYRNQMHDK